MGNYGNTVWKFRKFCPTAKIFRQIDLQYNSLVKKMIWRNFCKISWGKNLQISTVWCGKTRNFLSPNFFREINYRYYVFNFFISKNVTFTNFFQKSVREIFCFFHTVQCKCSFSQIIREINFFTNRERGNWFHDFF